MVHFNKFVKLKRVSKMDCNTCLYSNESLIVNGSSQKSLCGLFLIFPFNSFCLNIHHKDSKTASTHHFDTDTKQRHYFPNVCSPIAANAFIFL